MIRLAMKNLKVAIIIVHDIILIREAKRTYSYVLSLLVLQLLAIHIGLAL